MRWWSVTDGIEWKWKLPRLVINNWRRNAHIHTHARSIFRSFYTNQLLWFINIYLTSGQWQNKWERTQIVNNSILTFSPVFFFLFLSLLFAHFQMHNVQIGLHWWFHFCANVRAFNSKLLYCEFNCREFQWEAHEEMEMSTCIAKVCCWFFDIDLMEKRKRKLQKKKRTKKNYKKERKSFFKKKNWAHILMNIPI